MFSFDKLVKIPKKGSRFNRDEVDMDYDLSDQFTSSEEESDELDHKHSSPYTDRGFDYSRQHQQEDYSLLLKMCQDRDMLIRQHLQERKRSLLLEDLKFQSDEAFKEGDLAQLDDLGVKMRQVANRPRSKFDVNIADFDPSDPPSDPKYKRLCREIEQIEDRMAIRAEVSEQSSGESDPDYEPVSKKRRITRSSSLRPPKRRKVIVISDDE